MNYTYLSYGQKRAGLTLDKLNTYPHDNATKTRIFFAHIMDAINNKKQNSDEETNRLLQLALDENANTLKITIRALTHKG